MTAFGTAVIRRNDDGSLTVVEADETIGIYLEFFPADSLVVDSAGHLLLAGDPAFRYRPLRFASKYGGGPPTVLVCERVTSDG